MVSLIKTKTDNSEIAIAEQLFRVENELRLSAEATTGMQKSLSEKIMKNSADMKLLSDEMQKLDLLSQTLGGMADFLNALAKQTSDNWRLDPKNAYSVLKLEKLIASMKGQSPIDECSGDVDLF